MKLEPHLPPLPNAAARASRTLAHAVEIVLVILMIVLVGLVWLGIAVRYIVDAPITFTEEASRYVMIWTALLAVSVGIARREHIGVAIIYDRLPRGLQQVLLGLLDALALAFFLLLFWYGLGFASGGARQFTMIYGMTKTLPYAAVPVAAALAAVQLVLVAIRDQARLARAPQGLEVRP
jgi:TRAP-type C4-dicarboxylate transport system permease small subunit